jgi:hypothetical protein
MRSSSSPFEQINQRATGKTYLQLGFSLDARSPAGNLSVIQCQSQVFNVATPAPFSHSLTVVWFVDGAQQATGPTST